MTNTKRHLISRPGQGRTSCGAVIVRAGGRPPLQTTTEVAEVTCLACARTLRMADAEIERSSRRNRRR